MAPAKPWPAGRRHHNGGTFQTSPPIPDPEEPPQPEPSYGRLPPVTDALETTDLAEVSDRALSLEELQDLLVPEEAPPSISYTTQDYPVDALVKRLRAGAMRIPQFGADSDDLATDGFQRGFVWSKAQMDRFIESLLLGYPVPGIFLVKQSDNVTLVLDGQQRLETLQRFYDGVHNDRTFKLENVGDRFRGRSYSALDVADQLALDDSPIHATVVATDGSDAVNDAIYGLFERLNSGGTQLTAHEIRVALSAGPLMVLIEELNTDESWRTLYGTKNKRIRDHELVMRIVALHVNSASYTRPLKNFLNQFAHKHRDANSLPSEVADTFREAARVFQDSIGGSAFRRDSRQLNTAQTEALMVGAMRNIENGTLTADIAGALQRLRNDEVFERAVTRATADNDSVRDRLRLAEEALKAHD